MTANTFYKMLAGVALMMPTSCGLIEDDLNKAILALEEENSPEVILIDTIFPAEGTAGTIFALDGNGFSSPANDDKARLHFGPSTYKGEGVINAADGGIVLWSNTRIEFATPAATDKFGKYQVVVTTSKGRSNSIDFRLTAPPED